MGNGVIVACRMNSTRLPGKTLAMVEDRALLWYVVSRFARLSESGIPLVVATSDQWFDEPIETWCQANNIDCYRGSSEDVAGRLIACARSRGWQHFARVNGDSPFVDADLVADGFHRASTGDCSFVTNLVPRSFPYGVAVEVLDTDWYESWMNEHEDPADREHVTRSIYSNIESLRFENIERSGPNLSQWSLTVDTPQDLQWFRQYVGQLTQPWEATDYLTAIDESQRQRRAG